MANLTVVGSDPPRRGIIAPPPPPHHSAGVEYLLDRIGEVGRAVGSMAIAFSLLLPLIGLILLVRRR
jgi:hypothetical protein